ncbi:MAG: glutamate--tRNA ligase family protein, partial [Bacteroidetes bacterium]|nr:glutamate--tRNA ligase family protein [Bacteroidota bacterium]
RLNVSYTVMSKRKLLQLVNENHVSGWDDPRMPTIAGMRRRGYTPRAIREFCERAGIAKRDKLNEISLLEFCVREELNKTSFRRMVVFNPVKVVITNFVEEEVLLESENNPEEEHSGLRTIPFSKELYIEHEDFMENPPKKFFRMAIGQSVRLKSAYIVTCNGVIKDEAGNILEIHCTYIPESKSGHDTSGLKVQGTLHWVSIKHAIRVELREYDRLFKSENPALEEGDFKEYINSDSLNIIMNAFAEPALKEATESQRFQFLRKGYFCKDKDSTLDHLVFNRTVSLKESFTKEVKK